MSGKVCGSEFDHNPVEKVRAGKLWNADSYCKLRKWCGKATVGLVIFHSVKELTRDLMTHTITKHTYRVKFYYGR